MLILRSACAALSAAASLVYGADLPVTRGDPVVVTATRFEESRTDRPVNLTVITAEDIRRSPARTVPDLLAEQAGIVVHDFFGNNATTTTVDMRGFGITGGQNTLVLVDGRRVVDIDLSGVQWSAVPLSAIDRIEIVRGGGSVLYGEGASAGVINIITRRAQGVSLAVQGSAGSYDTREASVHGSFGSGSAGASVFGGIFESDGYRRNNQHRQTNALADLRWSGGFGDIALKLATDNQGTRLPGARSVQPSAGLDQLSIDRRGTNTPLDWAQREGNQALVDWRREFAFGEVNIGGGWRDKTQRSYFDFGGFPDYRDVDLTVWSFTPRVKVNLPLAGRENTLVAGFDLYSWDYGRRVSNSPVNINRPVNDIQANEETAGIYVLDTMALTRELSVSAGARRERLKIDGSDRFDPTAPGAFFGSAAPASSQRLYKNAYDLGARYQVTPAIAAMAKMAQSYRFANVDEIYEFSPAFTNQFQFLRPQTSHTQEVGVEARRGASSGRLTLFQMNVNDEIHLDPFTAGVGNRNLPPTRRRGLELEGSARPLGKLTVAAAYSYIEAKFREGTLAGSPFGTSIEDKTVPLVPRHKVTFKTSWDFTPATRLAVVASYVSDQFMDNDELNSAVKIPSYTLVDLKLSHRVGNWYFAATVNNLFGEKYYNYAVRSNFVADRYNVYPLPERHGLFTAEYRFR